MNKLVKIKGLITYASQPYCQAKTITIQCRCCAAKLNDIPVGSNGYVLPSVCNNAGSYTRCLPKPFVIIPHESRCNDEQVLTLEELSENVPPGKRKGTIKLIVGRYLTDKCSSGETIEATGILSGKIVNAADGVLEPFIRILGLKCRPRLSLINFPEDEETNFENFGKSGGVLDKIARSFAPFLIGLDEVKKMIICMLFGGSEKQMPDCTRLRGSINVLVLGK